MGKLLTSADFLTEQTYLNNKRRFVNGLLFGSGVVCGLSVYNLDDHSIMVESGVAIDGAGREIVVENSVVKKLSAIEGFEEALSDCVSLCLRYREEPVHPVYSINRQHGGEEYEYNRIREGWELFLADSENGETALGLESEFLNTAELYSDGDYTVTVSVPARVSCGSLVKLVVAVENTSGAPRELSMECVLQTPSFVDQNGEHEFSVELKGLTLEEGRRITREYWMQVQSREALDSLIVAKPSFSRILVDGAEKPLADNFLLKVSAVNLSAREIIEGEIGRINLESRSMIAFDEGIRLARITLQRTKNAYIIERVEEQGVKRYIQTTTDNELRREYEAYFYGMQPSQHIPGEGGPAEGFDLSAAVSAREPVYASGVCEIPIGLDMRRGDIEYSDEIMHGLGPGNVYVSVGLEYLADDPRLGEKGKNTIYGDAQMFADEDPPICYAESAVKVMNDRGSFKVAVRLLRETNFVIIVLRWVAIKLPTGNETSAVRKLSGKSIAAVQPTVVMATRESHFFNVAFKNMEPCALRYELTERGSGEITPDGIYTAPAREGVYEIRIFCADTPMIATYAYAVVKRKNPEEAEEA